MNNLNIVKMMIQKIHDLKQDFKNEKDATKREETIIRILTITDLINSINNSDSDSKISEIENYYYQVSDLTKKIKIKEFNDMEKIINNNINPKPPTF